MVVCRVLQAHHYSLLASRQLGRGGDVGFTVLGTVTVGLIGDDVRLHFFYSKQDAKEAYKVIYKPLSARSPSLTASSPGQSISPMPRQSGEF